MRASGPDYPLTVAQSAISPLPIEARRKRPAPFSIRLSEAERQRLVDEAGPKPLGTHIREKLLDGDAPARVRRTGASIHDREAHARALFLLGSARLTESIAELADLARDGALPFTPETESELRAALDDIRAIRRLLIAALGLKEGRAR